MTFNYQVGGSLPADAPSYVERQCDRDYYELLKERKYCYVFNCRQMGKSSLRVRVTHKLQAEGVVCATIDPQKIGVEVTCEQWYASAIRSLVGDLDLKSKFDLRSWIRERELLSPVQRFAEFIETVVLQEIDAPIVIFVEEIDRLLSLKFGMDDFFGLVRSFFEDRPTKPDYKRLTFSFLGVATPTDLIQSHNISAFNIGTAVEMSGFTLEEAMPLLSGIARKVANSQDYLKIALYWAGGQPFLTQRMLELIGKELDLIGQPPDLVGDWVEDLVQKRIVTNWEAQDNPPHLTTIRDRVTSVEENLRGRMLGCYQQILVGAELDDDRSEERSKLRLTGLVVRREGKFQSYNPIYRLVFNQCWVEQQLANLRPELYAAAFRSWQESEVGQNAGFLLRGQALEDAEVWARGKRLSDSDECFLHESREIERLESAREIERLESAIKLETERQARESSERLQELERQKREATEASNRLLLVAEQESIRRVQRANRRLRIGSLFMGITLISASLAGVLSYKVNTDIRFADIHLTSLEANAGFQENRGLDALLQAVKAGYKLKELDNVQYWSKQDIQIQPITSLHQSIYGITELNRLEGHKNWIRSVVFSPDGKTIASASSDNTIKLWTMDGKELTTLKGHISGVKSVMFSPNGKTIVSGSDDGTIKLWKLDGTEIFTVKHSNWIMRNLAEKNYGVRSVAFSPDGKTIVSGSEDQTIKLWNLEGKQLLYITGHTGLIRSIAFSPDGKTIASGSADSTIKLWNLQGDELQTIKGNEYGFSSVVFSPTGKIFAAASPIKDIIKIWNLEGKELADLKGHSGGVLSIAFSPDGKIIASGGLDKTIKLWNLKGEELQTLKGHNGEVWSVVFSPDSKTIASGSSDNSIKLWDLSRQKLLKLKGSSSIFNVSLSPNGKTIATGSDDGYIKLWDLQGKELLTIKGHTDHVWSVVFSPDGKTIASGSADKTIKLWDINGKQKYILKGHEKDVSSIVFSPNGKTLASGSFDGTIKFWNSEGKELRTINAHKAWILSLAFAPDGKTIASASQDQTIKLWNLEGKELLFLKDGNNSFWSVTFSPDSQTIASGSADKTLKLWNLQGKLLQTFKGHSGEVVSIDFSPDGKNIASGSWDKTIKLWNLKGREIFTFKGHNDKVWSIVFAPDGKKLISGSADQTTIIWNLDFDELMTKGCAWLHDYLVNNPNASDEDRQMCGIAPRQK
jgi:WD40 repeat protein